MPIKYYDSGTWKDYYGELTRDTVGRIYVNNRWKIGWKPPYKKLSYLQGNGVSYIDTLRKGNLNSEIELDIEIANNDKVGIFGSRVDSSTNSQLIIAVWNYATPQAMYGLKPLHVDFVNFSTSRASIDLDNTSETRFKIVASKSERYIYNSQGQLIASNTVVQSSSFETPTTLKLFKADNYAATNLFTGKIYRYKYKENGVLLQDMIPVQRLSDNKKGLFDLIEGKFYFSASSTPF